MTFNPIQIVVGPLETTLGSAGHPLQLGKLLLAGLLDLINDEQ